MKIAENTKASIFKIYRRLALDSPYIVIGNNVTIYFRSAVNCTNVSIFDRESLHRWLTTTFRKTTEASNSQIRIMVFPESLYVVTGNDIIIYFRSATNSVKGWVIETRKAHKLWDSGLLIAGKFFLADKHYCESAEYFGVFVNTMTSRRLPVQSVAPSATVWP